MKRDYFAAAYWAPETTAAFRHFWDLFWASETALPGSGKQYLYEVAGLFHYYDDLFKRVPHTREPWFLEHVDQVERTLGLPDDIRATLGVPAPGPVEA